MLSLPWDTYVTCIYIVLFNSVVAWKLGRLVEQCSPDFYFLLSFSLALTKLQDTICYHYRPKIIIVFLKKYTNNKNKLPIAKTSAL